MKTTAIGRRAEMAVAMMLTNDGYKILDQNWKTKVCEVDLIAKKTNIIYFLEVKYRSQIGQGSGFEYITPKKLDQIRFASQIWCAQNNWDGDCQLLGAEVSGLNFENINIIELDS